MVEGFVWVCDAAFSVPFVVGPVSLINRAVSPDLHPHSLANFSADNPLTAVSSAFIIDCDFLKVFKSSLRDLRVFLDLWLAIPNIFNIWVGKVALADRLFGLSLHFFHRIKAGLLFVRGSESTHGCGSLHGLLENKP